MNLKQRNSTINNTEVWFCFPYPFLSGEDAQILGWDFIGSVARSIVLQSLQYIWVVIVTIIG